MINEKYADYAWEQTAALLAIDSPSGFTRRAAEWVKTAFEALGFPAKITTKGGVLADLGGENADDGLFLEAHSDTLGAMVAQIKGSGRLRLTAVGGMEPNNAEAENVRIYTRSGKVYDGTWDEIGNAATSLGVAENAVGLPTATWSMENFSVADYEDLFQKVLNGDIIIDNNSEMANPAEGGLTNVNVNYIGG